MIGTIFLKPRLGIYSSYDNNTGMGRALKQCREHDMYINHAEMEFDTLVEEFEQQTGTKCGVPNFSAQDQNYITFFRRFMGQPTE